MDRKRWAEITDIDLTCYKLIMNRWSCWRTTWYQTATLWLCTEKNTNRRESCLYLTCSTNKSCIFWVQLVLTINHREQVCTRKHVSLSGSCYRFTAAVFTDELGRHRQEDWSLLILLQARKPSTFQSECTNVIGCMNLHWHIKIRISILY